MSTPKEVLESLRIYFKENKISRTQIAISLGFSTVQSVTNLFCSKHYLNDIQAKRLSKHYGLNYDYMTTGSGEMILPELNKSIKKDLTEEDTYLNPKNSYETTKIFDYYKNKDSQTLIVEAEKRKNTLLVSQYLKLLEELDKTINIIEDKTTKKILKKIILKGNIALAMISQFNDKEDLTSMIDEVTTDINSSIENTLHGYYQGDSPKNDK